jgi:hypothetical protein
MSLGRTSESVYDPNGLLIDRDDAFGEAVTIVSGQNLAAGSVLGQITSGGKYALALAASNDGSQTPCAIIPEACDASGGDKTAFVFYTGRFRQNKLVFGTGITAAASRRDLAQKGLKIQSGQAAV